MTMHCDQPGAPVEVVVPVRPGERTDHHGLAVAVKAGGVEKVTEQEVERTALFAGIQVQRAGRPLRLHRLKERSEIGLPQRTLSLHLR